MKKSYLEPEIEIVKFSFSDSVLKIIPSDNSDPTEDNVGEDVNDNDQLTIMSAGVLHLPTFLSKTFAC
mgnify:CR=1 FL=1